MEQFDTLLIQCRHIEHMHEGVYNFCLHRFYWNLLKLWSAGLNYNLPCFLTDSYCAGYLISIAYWLFSFAADDFSSRHFQMHFFGALSVKLHLQMWVIWRHNFLITGGYEVNPSPTSHNFLCPENVCFLRLLHIFKCTSDLILSRKQTLNLDKTDERADSTSHDSRA